MVFLIFVFSSIDDDTFNDAKVKGNLNFKIDGGKIIIKTITPEIGDSSYYPLTTKR